MHSWPPVSCLSDECLYRENSIVVRIGIQNSLGVPKIPRNNPTLWSSAPIPLCRQGNVALDYRIDESQRIAESKACVHCPLAYRLDDATSLAPALLPFLADFALLALVCLCLPVHQVSQLSPDFPHLHALVVRSHCVTSVAFTFVRVFIRVFVFIVISEVPRLDFLFRNCTIDFRNYFADYINWNWLAYYGD